MQFEVTCERTKKIVEEKQDETEIKYFYYFSTAEGYKLSLRSEEKLPIHRKDEFVLKQVREQKEVSSFTTPKAKKNAHNGKQEN